MYENNCYNDGAQFVAGVDEAGRGPLAGPMVIGAVILPQNVFIKGLNDSKNLRQPNVSSFTGKFWKKRSRFRLI